MIIKIDQNVFDNAFREMTKYATSGGISILIFVAYDCDAICACHILTSCLKSELIQFTIIAVESYEQLDISYREEIKENSHLRTIVLINCGGNIDLFDLFELEENHDKIKSVFVIDSHRPYTKANIENQQQIFLLDDGTGEARMNLKKKKKRRKKYEDDDDEIEIEEDEEEEEEDLDELAFHGFAAAGLMYSFATQLHMQNNNLLWLAILGLTDQLLQQRIDMRRYEQDYTHFFTEVRENNSADDSFMSYGSQGSSSQQNGDILCVPDYKFFMHRHWTLYESMQYSRYLVVKFQMWKGQKRLEELFAKMGIPFHEYMQQFSMVHHKVKERLDYKFQFYGEEFAIEDVTFPSFIRQVNGIISAADVVNAVSALLTSTKYKISPDLVTKGGGGSSGALTQQSQTQDSDQSINLTSNYAERMTKALQEQFWKSFDLLSPQATYMLGPTSPTFHIFQNAVSQSKTLQIAIIKQAIEIIQKKEITTTGRIHYCLLSESTHLDFLAHPLSLCKLAYLLVDMLAEVGHSNSRKSPKPIVLGALNESSGTYLVAGVPGAHSSEPLKQNKLGSVFFRATEVTGVKLVCHYFDFAVVSIQKEDMTKFMDYLRSGLAF